MNKFLGAFKSEDKVAAECQKKMRDIQRERRLHTSFQSESKEEEPKYQDWENIKDHSFEQAKSASQDISAPEAVFGQNLTLSDEQDNSGVSTRSQKPFTQYPSPTVSAFEVPAPKPVLPKGSMGYAYGASLKATQSSSTKSKSLGGTASKSNSPNETAQVLTKPRPLLLPRIVPEIQELLAHPEIASFLADVEEAQRQEQAMGGGYYGQFAFGPM